MSRVLIGSGDVPARLTPAKQRWSEVMIFFCVFLRQKVSFTKREWTTPVKRYKQK
jgi:hypothetical protein